VKKIPTLSFCFVACVFITSCGQDNSSLASVITQPSFTPLTPTEITIDNASTATIQYVVTNEASVGLTLELTPVIGITQNSAGLGLCASPLVLRPNQSCTLSLEIDGSLLEGSVLGGPLLCQQGGGACYNPDTSDILDITLI